MKASLVVSLRNKTLTEEQFRTAVCECQAVVNSRPLTYVSNDVDEEPLTPHHLLRGTGIRVLPPIEVESEELVDRQARHQYFQLLQVLQQFQRRWKHEYLTALQQRHKSLCIPHRVHQFKEGDVVVLHRAGTPRYTWPLARVLEVYPDDRGVIRTVKVLTDGEEYLRPVTQIVPLELQCERSVQEGGEGGGDEVPRSQPKENEAEAEDVPSSQAPDGENSQDDGNPDVASDSGQATVEEELGDHDGPPSERDRGREDHLGPGDKHQRVSGVPVRGVRRAALRQRQLMRELLRGETL